jgi:mycoredoxin
MKKIALLVLALALYQNWGKIHNWMAPAPPKHQEVVLYATSWCGYCAKTRELFAEQGIVYREENIEQSSAAREAYQRLGGRGVPVIDIRGTVIHGYNPQAILAAY